MTAPVFEAPSQLYILLLFVQFVCLLISHCMQYVLCRSQFEFWHSNKKIRWHPVWCMQCFSTHTTSSYFRQRIGCLPHFSPVVQWRVRAFMRQQFIPQRTLIFLRSSRYYSDLMFLFFHAYQTKKELLSLKKNHIWSSVNWSAKHSRNTVLMV